MSDRGALRIGALARAAGVSPDTLRHYERRGVLAPAGRSASGYRLYDAEAVTRVRLIRRALSMGFSLRELAAILRERARGGAPCRAVRALVATRLEELDRRVAELIDLRRDMRALLREWDGRLARTPAGRQARLLDTLGGRQPRRSRH
ncbi:MAG: heavy metal-responsive transcriptional regulator [Vicinamibacterales bacterium]